MPPFVSTRFASTLLVTALLSALAGCATPTSPPQAAGATGVAAAAAAPVAWGAANEAWWQDGDNAELTALIEAAMRANRDLRVAAARLAQARAGLDGAQADRLPQLALAAGAQRGRSSSADPKTDLSYGGLSAHWDLDLFGAKGLASQAAQRDALGAELAQQAARITLAAEVATAYVEIQSLARREALSRAAVATLERQIQVAQRRHEAGQSSVLEVSRLQADRRQEQANAVQLQGAQRIRLRQLAVLTGAEQPPTISTPLSARLPAAPAAVLPAQLLERRPDVRRQALAVEAATARVGVAKRDLYPRIEFDWAGRQERLKLLGAGGGASPSLVVGYGLSLSLPIFDGGRIRANIAVHEALAQEAMAEYEKALLGALADADTALVQLATAESTVVQLTEAVRVADEARGRSQRLFEAGLVDLGTVLDVQRGHLRAQDGLAQAQAAQWLAAVAVRRAFAGAV